MRLPILLFAAALAASGCRDAKRSLSGDDLVPQGELRVYTTPELAEVAERHARQFEQQFPLTRVTVETRSTRGAIVALLADSGRVAYTDRLLNAEEEAVNEGHPDTMRVFARPVGFGALVFVVHPGNPVAALPVDAVPTVARAANPTWNAFGGTGKLLLATTGKNSGTYEVLARQFSTGTGDLVPAFVGATPRAVMDFVASQPGGLGVVPLSALRDTAEAGVRVLPVRVGQGDTAYVVRPSQLSVYEQTYPLHYTLFVYTTGRMGLLPSRFAGFVGGRVGQRAIQTAGFVPETVPSRTVVLK